MLSGGAIGGLAGIPSVRELAALTPAWASKAALEFSGRPSTTPPSRQPAALVTFPKSPIAAAPKPSLRQHPLRLRTLPPGVPPAATDPGPAAASIAQQVIALTNQDRAGANLPPLMASPALTTAAQLHSQDMARLDVMSHDIPGVPLASLTDRAAYVHYRYQRLGENIAYNQADAASVVASWMNSPPHRENMLDPTFTQIGVGVAWNQRGEPYYTMMLGTPCLNRSVGR